MRRRFAAACLAATFFASTSPLQASDNVLVVLIDDIGVDQLAAYGLGTDCPPTPTIDALAANGLRFRNAWSNPLCSPTRSALLTGRHPFRTGMGYIVTPGTKGMPLSEWTIPEMLDAGTARAYRHAALGKWHLGFSEVDFGTGDTLFPNLSGFGHYAGTPDNPAPDETGYSTWLKVVNGAVTFPYTGYLTTDTAQDAIAWIRQTPEPWFAYVPFNAAHSPFHAPPPNLHSTDFSQEAPSSENPRPYYKAMVEALDHELGRLLRQVDLSRTTVILIGDNGTPGAVVAAGADPDKAKGSVFQGGIHVPLIVASPRIATPGGTCNGLVQIADIFATVAELAGVDLEAVYPHDRIHDSKSFVPYFANPELPSLHEHVYAEMFRPNGVQGTNLPFSFDRAIRNQRYKLIETFQDSPRESFVGLYDLETDPLETTNLLEPNGGQPGARAIYHGLKKAMAALHALQPGPPLVN